MQEKYPDRVVAITWNLEHDDADSQPSEALQQAVLKKLVSLDMHCLNVISSDPMDDVYKHHDIFAPPVVLVYGSDGTLANKFEGAFTYDKDVFPFVEKLLE